jgi:3-oxoacyl-[acyl-carrier-protein] synthase-1
MFEVAITGIGIVSVLGTGIEKVARSLKLGQSGIVKSPEREALGFRSPLTGAITDFTAPPLEIKKRKTMTDFTIQAWAAALEATAMAGWDETLIRSPETGLIVGNDSSALASIRGYEITKERGSTLPIGAGLVFQALNSTITMNLNTLLGTKGAAWTLSGACASGGHSIGQAADLIRLGRQERIICGGTQEITWESTCSFDATNAFSMRTDCPEKACRPFDAGRDGLVPSGGAAILCLERLDLAKKRGAVILGKVAGYGFSSDGEKLSVPSGEGLVRSMGGALKQAGTGAGSIDYISAHATSTPVGDQAEARAINGVFGNETPWISSLKGMTGHEMWMAGASQVVYSVLMNRDGFIAPNLNYETPDPELPPLKIASETVDLKPRKILCNAAGFGGTNSSLVLDFT